MTASEAEMSKSTPKTTPSRISINIPSGQDDYVDKRTGTTWKYFASLKNEEELAEVLKKHWLYKYQEHPNTINCRCSRNRIVSKGKSNCEFRAVFLKSNCKLYTVEQHNHPVFDKGFSSSDNVYVDKTGQTWNFLTAIRDDQHLKEVCQQQWIRKEGAYVYHCKNACPFRAIHIEGAMFTREQHNHEVVNGIEGKSEKFMVLSGIVWRLIARDVNDEAQLDDIRCQQMLKREIVYQYQGQQGPVYRMFYCRWADKLKCKFRGRFFPDFGNFYLTNEHNHPSQKMNRAEISKTPKVIKRKKMDKTEVPKTPNGRKRKKMDKTEVPKTPNGRKRKKMDKAEIPKTPNGRKRKRIESSSEEGFEEESSSDSEEEENMDFEYEEDSDSEMAEEKQEVQNEHVLDGKLHEIEENILAEKIFPSIKVEVVEEAMGEWQEALDAGKENAILEETNEICGNRNEPVALYNLKEINGLNQNQAELEVHFVEEINHQEYKMLPPMKRECDDNSIPKQWPTVTIESEVAGWQWQQTRSQKEALLRPVKKEEPAEEEELPAELPQPNQPTTSNANNPNPLAVARHKMYLRARKPVNYAEN